VTLHDSLMARLDRLGPAKEVLQIGAVIGGKFSYELLHAVHPVGAEELQSALRSATDAELVYVRGIAPDATYQFKHALIRDAAYEALLKSRRKELHGQVARTISDKFPDLKEAHPEVLAYHWTEAGEPAQAITEWTRAGKVAESHHAFKEAQQSYEQALAQIKLLPQSPKRELRQLELQNSVLRMLQLTKGWAAVETVEASERTAVLAEKTGGSEQIEGSLAVRAFTAYISGDLRIASVLLDQALDLALRNGNPTILAYRYMLQVLVHFMSGDFAGAEQHFTTGLAFFDDPVFKNDPVGGFTAVLGIAAENAWILSQSDIARERQARIMGAVNERNPHDIAWSNIFSAILHLMMREYGCAEALAPRALELCEKHHFPNEAAFARCILGTTQAQLGSRADGIALIRQGITELLHVGNRTTVPIWTLHLADAQRLESHLHEALETVEQALQFNPAELVYRPEGLRLRGEIHLKLSNSELAEADFREAIALAQKMGAKAWELRAATSFARLLQDTGRHDEARSILAEIYNWFTEGFDTPDLKDAKALLEELAT
jgi:tetratricopeptide (TPR) repeat protein